MRGLINNQWDRDNLHFLLNTGDEAMADWYAQADADDLVYAQELLDAYSRELKIRSQDLIVEAEMAQLPQYPDANNVIDKFRR
jgi:hypothetical protein